MNKKNNYLLGIALLAIIFSGCNTVHKMSIEKLSTLKKGIDFEYFYNYQEPLIKNENVKIEPFDCYFENSFEYDDVEGLGNVKVLFYYYIIYKGQGVYRITYLVLAFEDDKLIYWGYPEDFRNLNNPKINKIADAFYNDLHNVFNN